MRIRQALRGYELLLAFIVTALVMVVALGVTISVNTIAYWVLGACIIGSFLVLVNKIIGKPGRRR